jgi:hypothetical protein
MQRLRGHQAWVVGCFSSRAPLWAWWLGTVVGFMAAKLVQLAWLDPAYAASGFPVPFYVGQTTFNAAELKSYYQVMLDLGTMHLYHRTQLIDCIFILCTYAAFFLLTQSIYHSLKKLAPTAKRSLKLAVWMCFIAPLAALADAAENAVSFIMLLNPTEFFDGWVLKFALFVLTYLWGAAMALGIFMLAVVQAGGRLGRMGAAEAVKLSQRFSGNN